MYKDEILIRPAEMRDMRKVFELSNDLTVRGNSINVKTIEWTEHEKWYVSAMSDHNLKFYIAETTSGGFVG